MAETGLIHCPACNTRLVPCKGMEDMPASQEYWFCSRCGLNAHHTRLISANDRAELRREHESTLRKLARDGRRASAQLQAIRQQTRPLISLAVAIAGLGLISATATLLYRLWARNSTRPDRTEID